ncbi:DUF6348 family protein [Kitasatospora sp. NPDC092948]|uniref:DUF6348 family protein n=1 Tax=Kitasatospora sp. NPDC092948 TaxID=3364088 RepID=UPI00381912B7
MADELSALHGEPWRVEEADGLEVRGPGALAVRIGEPHRTRAEHLDLVFLVDRDRPETAVTDCVNRTRGGEDYPLRRGIELWAATTAVSLIELVAHNGRFAGHLDPHDPDGMPGWHAIHGGTVGWGVGERHHVVQDWLLRNPLLPALAPALGGDLGRDQLVGVKVVFGSRDGMDTADVRVGGEEHAAASAALAALDWPRFAEDEPGESYARTFILLVHREGDRRGAPTVGRS